MNIFKKINPIARLKRYRLDSPLFWSGGGGEACILCLFIFLPFSLSAQLFDDFSDGDFTNNPAWSGNTADFIIVDVNGNNMLRSNSDSASSNFYLSTPNTLIKDCQWEFYVNLQFNTSGANFVDVYLTSDSANLKAVNNNGYFVKIGNTQDEVSLYRKVGGTSTKIIDGVDGILNFSNNILRVRVIRDSMDMWTLERDVTGTGLNYFLEGTVTDATVQSGSHFGIFIQQSTVSFHKRHFFDSIYVGAIIGDTIPPRVTSVTATSPTMLDVKFSEPVSVLSSQNTGNYFADNSIGNPLTAVRNAGDSSIVQLTFGAAVQNCQRNALTVSGVEDLAGNVMAQTSIEYVYLNPDTANAGDIIINEIFANPTGTPGLPAKEFVELYNRTSKAFILTGWTLLHNTTVRTINPVPLCPNEYLILTAGIDTALFAPFGNVAGTSASSNWLTNSGATLSLRDNNSNIINAVTYSDTWYRDASKSNGGWSLERIDPDFPCPSPDNWIASNDPSGGTPGRANSVMGVFNDSIAPQIVSLQIASENSLQLVFNEPLDSQSAVNVAHYTADFGLSAPNTAEVSSNLLEVLLTFSLPLDTGTVYTLTINGVRDCPGNILNTTVLFAIPLPAEPFDVIISEVFPRTDPSVGLPEAQFVELLNCSNKPISLAGWKFADRTTTATLQSQLLLPGEYIILCGTSNAPFYLPFGKAMGVSSFPSLNTTSEDLTMRDNNDMLIDKLSYTNAFYQDVTKSNGGWTIERIDTGFLCESSLNWRASEDISGGTPGRVNSVNGTTVDPLSPTVTGVEIISANALALTFSKTLEESSAVQLQHYSVNNGIGQPDTADISANLLTVTLMFNLPFDSNTIYSLAITGIRDCPGNLYAGGDIQFAVPQPSERFDVLITEIFANTSPQVALPTSGFVEIHNRSDKAINLSGWKFSDRTSTATLPAQLLLPGEYIILCPIASVSAYTIYGKTIGLSPWPSPNISSDDLTLKNEKESIIHYVSYTDTWYGDVIKRNGGWTLEMIDTDNPCSGASNWRASVDPRGGTPAQVNSVKGINPDVTAPALNFVQVTDSLNIIVFFDEPLDISTALTPANYSIDGNIIVIEPLAFTTAAQNTVSLSLAAPLQRNRLYTLTVNNVEDCAGNPIGFLNNVQFGIPENPESMDIVINEILAYPVVSGSRFIEIYNHSEKVIDLKDILLGRIRAGVGDTSSVIITPNGFQLLPKTYLALTSNPDNILQNYYTPNPKFVINVSGLPAYDNNEDIVVLFNRLDNNSVIDQVHYFRDWHFELLDDRRGVSLERINYNGPSQDKNNWHSAASTVGYATPAYRNSQFGELAAARSTITLEPKTFSPNQDGYNDFLNIRYKLEQQGFLANIIIYDSNGRKVRRLVENQLLDLEGVFIWDGVTDSGEIARIGVHIVIAELFDPQGNMKKFKETCVVAGRL